MERRREEWKEKLGGMEKKEIKWKWNRNDGTYGGEIKNEKPHGVGKWKDNDCDWIIEGEWKDGQLDGNTVQNWSDGDRYEYEVKDGRQNGKCIRYYKDGRRE